MVHELVEICAVTQEGDRKVIDRRVEPYSARKEER